MISEAASEATAQRGLQVTPAGRILDSQKYGFCVIVCGGSSLWMNIYFQPLFTIQRTMVDYPSGVPKAWEPPAG